MKRLLKIRLEHDSKKRRKSTTSSSSSSSSSSNSPALDSFFCRRCKRSECICCETSPIHSSRNMRQLWNDDLALHGHSWSTSSEGSSLGSDIDESSANESPTVSEKTEPTDQKTE